MTAPPPAAATIQRPRRFWTHAGPGLARHLTRTMPWVTLLAGCASGTLVLAVIAHFAGQTPINQNTVRVTFLPAVAALAFVPHVHFRPVIHTTPVPSWIAPVGHTLLALPVVALTCWMQLALMASTVPAAYITHQPAVYPLLAQLTGWSVLTLAIADCCERTRYAALSGAIAAPFSFAAIAIATYTRAIKRVLATPPATSHAATVGWYTITAAALVLTGLAIRDQWQRYTRRLHL